MAKADSSVERHFGKAASLYSAGASSQRSFAQRLGEVLLGSPELKGELRILEIGCGTGFLTELLLEIFPEASITALDISAEMIEQARANISSPRVEWRVVDAREYIAEEPFSLVTSSSALQWLLPLDRTFARVHQHLQPGGVFAASIVCAGTFKELFDLRRNHFQHRGLPTSLSDHKGICEYLLQAGFGVEHQEREEIRQFYESARHFLSSIKELGFTSTPFSVGMKPLTRKEILKLMRLYEREFASETRGVGATFAASLFFSRKLS